MRNTNGNTIQNKTLSELWFGKYKIKNANHKPKQKKVESLKNNNHKKMKLTIIGKREIAFTGNDGKEIEGTMYLALTDKGQGIEFFSREEHDVNEGTITYNSNLAEEIKIEARMGKQGIKYSEKP